MPHLPSPLRRLLAAFLLLLLGQARVASAELASGTPLQGADQPPAAELTIDGCLAASRAGRLDELRASRELLLARLPLRPGLEQTLVAAELLLACGASDAALGVLTRVSPSVGEDRRRWLVLQWRVAHAGLHHAQAAQALRLLADGESGRLEQLLLPVAWPSREGQAPPRRVALDLLADHLQGLGQDRLAAEVLLSSREPGAARAARWGRAATLAADWPAQERDAIMERALEQAAAAQAWGLVAELLDQQLESGALDPLSMRALERRLRLGARIDDAYGEFLQRRRQPDAASDPRLLQLEGQLRSPLSPGGHAEATTGAPMPPLPSHQP